MKRSLLALAVVAMATSAHADNRRGWYIGGGPGFIDTGVASGDGGSVGFSAIEFYGGYKLNPYVGGELRLGTGLGDDNDSFFQYEIPYTAAAYYRVESANQVAKLYGLLGAAVVSIEATSGNSVTSDTPVGLSYGAGIGFVIGPRGNLNFEIRQLLNNADYELEVVSASYDFRF